MKFIKYSIVFVFVLAFQAQGFSQSWTWTGSVDNDFFNELNWVITGSEASPGAGSIDPGVVITEDMVIGDAVLDISTQGTLTFSPETKGIALSNATFKCDTITAGLISLSNNATLEVISANPLGELAVLDIMDMTSWVKLPSVDPYVTDTVYFDQFVSDGVAQVLDEGIRINQYYHQGSLVRLLDSTYAPLTLYDDKGLAGESFSVPYFQIYSRSELGDFDNKTSSFRLERGYEVCMTIFQNGTGKSQVFVASEEALEIDLPQALDNNVSFIRVMPWNWVTKKGASKFLSGVGATWTYNWSPNGESLPDQEYAPMAWGGGAATPAAVLDHIEKEKVTHIMGFNESDNCNDQSGQYGNLCQIDVAVPTFKNLMGTGLRLVSPSPRENGPFTWLKDFRDAALESDVRYDVLGVHWYDWGGNPVNTPFEDAQKIFNRFKNYLKNVYAEHQMPIWITEFNANANRDKSVHLAFLELALPYLDSLDYIERYDYFEPSPAVAGNREDIEFGEFFDVNGDITPLGELYRDHVSSPSIPEATWSTPSFLKEMDVRISIQLDIQADTLSEGEYVVLRAETARSVGSPQTFSFVVENLASDQYAIQKAELTIPEGGTSAETILSIVNDEVVEDTALAIVKIIATTDGIEWIGAGHEIVIISEDVEPEVPLDILPTKSLIVLPNPVEDTFQIMNLPEDARQLEMVSMEGRVYALSGENGWYDVSGFSSGLYMIRCFSKSEEIYTQKIIIR
ncbi:glycosyl hydrolase [Marinoscillum sp. MHG1-6]|uniref:glycosyl hydrolase n=1 Tax=Marinoscillum sp. MHG1-6 TaxID=2959627 RepID=UPI002156F896|nr:glycosyl hydrolase [Marinoscillum sp. MHG1-6]